MQKQHSLFTISLLFSSTFAQDDSTPPEGAGIFFLDDPLCPGSDGILNVPGSFYNGSCASLLGSTPDSAQVALTQTGIHQQMDLFGDTSCSTLLFSITNDGLNGTTDVHSLGESGCVTAPNGTSFQAMRYTTAGLSNPGPQPVSSGSLSNPGPTSVSSEVPTSTDLSNPGPQPVSSSPGLTNPGPTGPSKL